MTSITIAKALDLQQEFEAFQQVGVIGKIPAALQIPDLQIKKRRRSRGIAGVCRQTVVGRDTVSRKNKGFVPLGHLVDIKEHLFGGGGIPLLAAMHGILPAADGTRVIPVAVVEDGDAGIVLLDAGDDLLVQLVLHRLQWCQQGIRIGVLRLQVTEHVRVLALVVAQPVVLVLALGAMRGLHHVRFLGGVGRGGDFGSVCGHGEGECEEECMGFHGVRPSVCSVIC